MSTFSERINAALTQIQAVEPYKNKTGLAKHVGVRPSSITDWFSGRTKNISYKNAVKAAEYLRVSAMWLADGSGDMKSQSVTVFEDSDPEINKDENFVMVPLFKVRASAGPGQLCTYDEVTEKGCGIILPRSWFQERQINPDNCKTFLAKGDSMEPYIWDGDMILVDCSQREIISGRVYMFSYRGEMRVKKLRSTLSGIQVISYNPDVPDEEITNDDTQFIEIIGRVVNRSGNSGF